MKKTIFLIPALLLISFNIRAQDFTFKKLNQTHIKGAVKLTQTKFVKSGDKYMTVAKFGQAAPALYDWDADGKLDMLVGEFGGGKKANILVFKNIGTKKKPLYSDEPFYAKDSDGNYLFISGH